MDHNNIKFKVVSLNVRGIRTFEKGRQSLTNKYFIYHTKLNKTSLSFKSFFERIESIFQIERFIARKNNKLEILYNKWKPLLQLIEQ